MITYGPLSFTESRQQYHNDRMTAKRRLRGVEAKDMNDIGVYTKIPHPYRDRPRKSCGWEDCSNDVEGRGKYCSFHKTAAINRVKLKGNKKRKTGLWKVLRSCGYKQCKKSFMPSYPEEKCCSDICKKRLKKHQQKLSQMNRPSRNKKKAEFYTGVRFIG